MMIKLLRYVFCLLLCTSALAANLPAKPINSQRPEVQTFIKKMVTAHQFNRAELETLFDTIKLREDVLRAMKSPYEAKPWYIYRKHFMKQQRIDGGVKFWQQHKTVLQKVSQHYGLPVPIIVAIIGVETHYGARRGHYPVLDTLATFAFDYPSRQKFFTRELEQFLLLSREQKWDPKSIKGSYAGAVGQPQFMPSSYRAYAIDYANKGTIDLFDNIDDIIASVANYLARNGWQRDQPIATNASVVGTDYKKLTKLNGTPKYTLSELLHYGIHVKGKYADDTKAMFFVVDTSKTEQAYWIGFTNFYVITRYNTSKLYALAVTQLSQAIDTAYQRASKKAAVKKQTTKKSRVKKMTKDNPTATRPVLKTPPISLNAEQS